MRKIKPATVLFLLSFLLVAFNVTVASAGPPDVPLTIDEQQMVELINQYRVTAGLQPYRVDMTLEQAARLKARELSEQDYFTRQFPGYGSPFKIIRAVGLKYRYAGETVIMATSAEAAFSSIESGRNVSSDKFSRIGVGVAAGGSSKIFTLLFAGGQGSVSFYSFQQAPQQQAPQPVLQPVPHQPQVEPAPMAGIMNNDERQMLNLVNQERAAAGLQPLQADMALVQLARMKARDMIDKGYFAHQSPTYGSPFEMIREAAIEYRYAGENLAGAPGVDSAHENLMNSPGHRANILNANYRKAGIGVVDGGPYGKMFVQLFIG